MAKKKVKRRRALPARMMVLRVSVPGSYVPSLKAYQVLGIRGERLHSLEILSAYYDMPGQPNARR